VRDERAGGGAAVNLLQDRGLDFKETLGVQGFSDPRSTLLRAAISSRDSALIARST